MLYARGKFSGERRRLGRADVFGAQKQAVERGLKFFAQRQHPDPLGEEKFFGVRLGVRRDPFELFDLRVLLPDGKEGVLFEHARQWFVHALIVADFFSSVKPFSALPHRLCRLRHRME